MKLPDVPALIVLLSLLIGCQSRPADPESSVEDESDKDTQQAEGKYPIPEVLVDQLPDAEHPTTLEGFKAEFTRRFEADMYSSFIDLAYWGDASDRAKREYLEGVKATFARTQSSRASLQSPADIQLQTVAEYGDYGYWPNEGEGTTLSPSVTHVMDVTGHYNESFRVANSFAVGEKDGRYYFSTITPKEIGESAGGEP